MIKSKDTKRAFYASILSMIVCLAMLIGSTFAWFTDSVVSGNNQIVAGNLDVELWHQNGNVNDKVEEDTELFANKDGSPINWEPGAMVYENFTVKNVGSLAFNYQFMVDVKGANTVRVGDQDISLKDVLKVAILKNQHVTHATREEILADSSIEFQSLKDFKQTSILSQNGAIEKNGDPKKYAMIIYWEPSENDDDYNLNNGSVATNGSNQLFIELSASLYATQHNIENDSFGDDYDKGLTPTANGLEQKFDDYTTLNFTDKGEVILKQAGSKATGKYNVPNGVTKIGSSAFSNRDAITEIYLPDTVKILDYISFAGTKATKVVLNEGLTTIGLRTFEKAINLQSINFPSTLTSIGGNAFQASGLSEVTIPESVKEIHASAFRDMPNLTTLRIKGNTRIYEYTAKSCPNLTHVYLEGDDVTFGGDVIFTNSDDGNASEITIHVKNDEVKRRLEIAQAKAHGYHIEVDQ